MSDEKKIKQKKEMAAKYGSQRTSKDVISDLSCSLPCP